MSGGRSAEPLRLLMTADAVGGVFNYALDLANALRPHGIETAIALVGPVAGERSLDRARRGGLRLIETGLQLDWLADGPTAVAEGARRLAELASDTQASVVHLNSPAFAAGSRFRQPVVAVNHSCLATWWSAVRTGPPPVDFAWRAALNGAGLRAADAAVAPSRAFAAMTTAQYRLARPVLPVLNGRTLPPAPPSADDIDHRFAFTAGRLWDDAKNVAVLDRAAALSGRAFLAAGPLTSPQGERRDFEHLQLLGQLDEAAMRRWLGLRPVFVSAALYEPFGLSVLEAAQSGCPLVLSDIPTFRELWGGAAIFVRASAPEAFAGEIDRLADDPERRRQLGEAARRRAGSYTVGAMAGRMAPLYRMLVSRGLRGAAA